MAEYTAAVIGCGGRGGAHADAYRLIDRATVVACADVDPARAEALAKRLGIKPYADSAEMLASEKPDLVHITTPPTARVDVMTLVSDAGVPACTVEKPLATGAADWRELVALEAASRTRFAVCHQFRYHEDLTRCREALEGGDLGEVRFIEISAGMNISGQGTHVLDYGMSLNGDSPVARVFGAASGTRGLEGYHPAPDSTTGYLVFENGVRASWTMGPLAPRFGDPETEWQHVRAAAYADRGRVEWREFGEWVIVGPGPGRDERGEFGGMDAWRAGNAKAQAAFHEAMLDWIEDASNTPGTNLAQSLHEWKVVLALYESAARRAPVDLATFDPQDGIMKRLADALGKR
jgi:predicted dehydrogenase